MVLLGTDTVNCGYSLATENAIDVIHLICLLLWKQNNSNVESLNTSLVWF